MNHDFSFRSFACLYLDIYCATHVQREVLSETQTTHARVRFHEFLAALDAPVIMTAETVSKNTRHVLCDTDNLKRFVAQFACDFLGYSATPKPRSSN